VKALCSFLPNFAGAQAIVFYFGGKIYLGGKFFRRSINIEEYKMNGIPRWD